MSQMSFGREVASVLLKVTAVILTIILVVVSITIFSTMYTAVSDGNCNIAVMSIDGVIMPFGNGYEYADFVTTPADVRDFLKLVKDDPFIEGVMFEINSPGGAPVASETIAEMMQQIELPNVALIGDIAASGGYMIAAAADTVIASPMSDVGSIGVTMSYLEESKKNEEDGLTYVPLNSGKFKDTGSPYKPLTDDERKLLEGQLQSVHEYFVDLVTRYRNINRDSVAELADGSTMTGKIALEKQLVDRLGTRLEAKKYFNEQLNKGEENINFCDYQPLELLG